MPRSLRRWPASRTTSGTRECPGGSMPGHRPHLSPSGPGTRSRFCTGSTRTAWTATTSGGSPRWSRPLASQQSPGPDAGALSFHAATWANGAETIPCIFREPRREAASGGAWLHVIELSQTTNPLVRRLETGRSWAPPTGFEPALTAPEAVALSPELRGLTLQDYGGSNA